VVQHFSVVEDAKRQKYGFINKILVTNKLSDCIVVKKY